jgi:hypothetical protein
MLKERLRKLADVSEPGSLATKLRKKRFALFKNLLETAPNAAHILDVGGTQTFWERMGFPESDAADADITILNLTELPTTRPQFRSVAGDATDMSQYGEKEFDVVFSNSVIEHLGSFEAQRRMAAEIRRVGKRYFLQTPSRYFPIEPHFLFPFFQFLPRRVQVFLIARFDIGRNYPTATKLQVLNSLRLLSKKDMETLFPEARIVKERFLGLTKSYIVYNKWSAEKTQAA